MGGFMSPNQVLETMANILVSAVSANEYGLKHGLGDPWGKGQD